MTAADPVPLLLLCGASGVGKSSVAWEIYYRLAHGGVPIAHLDLDQVGHGPPGWLASYGIKVRNMASVWQNFAAAGAGSFVVSGVGSSGPEIDACTALIPAAAPTVCLLTVDEVEQRKRILGRARAEYGVDCGGASTSMSASALARFVSSAAKDLATTRSIPGAIEATPQEERSPRPRPRC